MTIRTAPCAGDFLLLARSCLETTERLLHKYRYRIAGTPECREAAHEIADHFRRSCDRVHEEAFLLHPKALWYVGKAVAANYLLTAVLLTLGGYFCYLGAFLCILGLSYGLVQYVFYGKIFDRAFKSAGGCNVVGSLEPQGVATQQIVLVGHHDSAFIFSFLERFPRLAFTRFLLGMLFFAWLCLYSFVASVQQLLSCSPQALTGTALWITIAGLAFALQLFFMMSSAKSPGAGDNLNSISMVATIAQYFSSARSGDLPLKHTRLILLSTDGEEIGQRGAIQFVQDHDPQLHATPTFVLNVDSVYHLRNLAVLTRDRNCTIGLSDSMISDIRVVASDCGIHLKRRPIPFGGGGTDAAAFAVSGFKAISIIGMPTGVISKDHLYHTSRDTVERIEVLAVGAVLAIVAGYIRMVDDQARE